MRKNKNDKEKRPSYVPEGKKLAITPRKGESSTKSTTIVKGASKVNMPNGIYTPKPTTGGKTAKPAAKPAAKKSKYKAPSSKKVFGNVKSQNKKVQRRGLKKC